MGYFVPASASGELTNYASVGTALTALRADGTAQDGDVYKADGSLYVAHATDSDLPFLVPAEIAGRFTLGSLLTKGGGDCIVPPADDLDEVRSRGWTTTNTSGNATVTKAADGPVVINAPGSGDLGDLRFEFDETPTSILVFGKISAATGTVDTNSGLYAGNGSVYSRLSWTSGVAGTWDFLLDINPISGQLGALSDVTDTYVWSVLDGSASDGLCGLWTPDGLQLVTERDDNNVAALNYIRVRTGYTGGAASSCSWDELAAIALS